MNTMQEFLKYLENQKEACLKKADELSRDSRGDEADMEKIRANIYGVAASVCLAAEKQSPGDPAAFAQSKLETIPDAWRKSLAEAERHGDHVKAELERTKLDTMSEIAGTMAGFAEKSQ